MNDYPLASLVTLALIVLGWQLATRVSKARETFAEQHRDHHKRQFIGSLFGSDFYGRVSQSYEFDRAFGSLPAGSLDICDRNFRWPRLYSGLRIFPWSSNLRQKLLARL